MSNQSTEDRTRKPRPIEPRRCLFCGRPTAENRIYCNRSCEAMDREVSKST